ncbi:hypothetical protein BH23ACT10_BH23ACT10_24520 [soil metagenome]
MTARRLIVLLEGQRVGHVDRDHVGHLTYT